MKSHLFSKLCFGFVLLLHYFSVSGQNDAFWTRVANLGGSGTEDIRQMTYYDGSFYMAGTFRDTTQILGTEIISSGNDDIFIAKFDTTEKLTWIKTFGGKESDYFFQFFQDSMGHFYLSLDIRDTCYAGKDTFFASHQHTTYLLKLDQNGLLLDHYKLCSGTYYKISGLQFRENGNLTGYMYFNKNLFLDTVSLKSNVPNILLFEKNSQGSLSWFKRISGTQQSNIKSKEMIYQDSFFYITGTFYDSCYFSQNEKRYSTGGKSNLFFAKYDHSGTLAWVHQVTPTEILLYDLELFKNLHYHKGHIFTTGLFDKAIDYNGKFFSSNGSTDLIVMKLDTGGNVLASKIIGSTLLDHQISSMISKDDKLIVLGSFSDSIVSTNYDYKIKGSQDPIVLKLDLNDGLKIKWVLGFGAYEKDPGRLRAIESTTGLFIYGNLSEPTWFESIHALNQNGSKEAFMAKIFEGKRPFKVIRHPEPKVCCKGDSIFLFVHSSKSGLKYQWQKKNKNIPGKNDSFLIFRDIQTDDFGLYSCVVSNKLYQESSKPATILVNTIPEITSVTGDTVLKKGSYFMLKVVASGNYLDYQWYHNGQEVTSQNMPGYHIFNLSEQDTGDYFCEVSNNCGKQYSDTIHIGMKQQGNGIQARQIFRPALYKTGSGNLIIDNISPGRAYDLTIYDLSGKTLAKRKLHGQSVIKTNSYPAGFYLVRIDSFRQHFYYKIYL